MLLTKWYTLKASSTRIIDIFKMSKRWFDKLQKRHWQVWTVGNQQTATFPLMCKFWRMGKRKAISSLTSHRPVDWKNTRIKACKLQRLYFSKVYIRLEVEERLVWLFEYCLCIISFLFSSFSTIKYTKKLLIITLNLKKIFSWA